MVIFHNKLKFIQNNPTTVETKWKRLAHVVHILQLDPNGETNIDI